MAEASGSAVSWLPQPQVWDYLLQVDNWVAELQGYDGHTLRPDGSIVLQMRGEIGFMTKVSRIEVTIVDQQPPSRLTLALRGLNDPLQGDGEMRAEPTPEGGTRIDYRLALSARGIAAPVLNEFLDRVLPNAVGDLATRLAERLSADGGTAGSTQRGAGPDQGRRT